MSESLRMELRDIDWDEALVMNALVDFERRRSDAIHREWPIGTCVRWLQTPEREVFEAEGVVSYWATELGEHPDVVSAGVHRSNGAWVTVRFTKHPSLEGRPADWPMLLLVPVRELERIDDEGLVSKDVGHG